MLKANSIANMQTCLFVYFYFILLCSHALLSLKPFPNQPCLKKLYKHVVPITYALMAALHFVHSESVTNNLGGLVFVAARLDVK